MLIATLLRNKTKERSFKSHSLKVSHSQIPTHHETALAPRTDPTIPTLTQPLLHKAVTYNRICTHLRCKDNSVIIIPNNQCCDSLYFTTYTARERANQGSSRHSAHHKEEASCISCALRDKNMSHPIRRTRRWKHVPSYTTKSEMETCPIPYN
jgi:hypothetical protein